MKGKNKLQEIQAKGRSTLIAILVIGIAVYLGFSPLFDRIGGGVAGAVVGASFGAIFVIVLTMYLLNKQTEIEQESKKSERVFDEKVKLYKQILSNTKDMVEDGEISIAEITKLPFLMMELQMIGGDKTISAYETVFSKINEIFEKHEDEVVTIDEEEKLDLYKEMSKFSRYCRVDLGVSHTELNEELFDRTVKTIQKSSNLSMENRRRSVNANYLENDEQFFRACQEKGRSTELINVAKDLYEALRKKYNSEFKAEEFDIDLVFGKDKNTSPKLSVKAASKKDGKLSRFCTIYIANKELQIHNIFKSPKWDYKQLKVGGFFFQHARDYWKKSSLYNDHEESLIYKAHKDYLPEMKVYGIANFNEDSLKTLLSVLDESKRVVFEDIKLPRTDLLRKADNGNEEAIKTIKKYIAEDYTETIEPADL